jgi:hypothetical protein
MKTILVEIDNAKHVQAFLNAVANLDYIKSVKLLQPGEPLYVQPIVREPVSEYNWTNPSRPAKEEEIDILIEKMENSSIEFSTDDVRIKTKQWATQKSK